MPDRDGQPALPSRPASSTSQPAKKKLRPSGGRGPRLRRIPGDTYVRVRACTCVYVRVRMCTCAYVRVHMCTFVYVRVHSCTYVYVRLQRCTYVYVGVPGNSTQAGARDPSPSQGSFFFFAGWHCGRSDAGLGGAMEHPKARVTGDGTVDHTGAMHGPVPCDPGLWCFEMYNCC